MHDIEERPQPRRQVPVARELTQINAASRPKA
jgi:hypothetical protein